LRHTLNKMQVSLLKHNTTEVYLRSAPTENEASLQQKMGLKQLLPIISKDNLIL